MKRVLSLGDIACDESEDVDGDNGVFTQVRSRRGTNRSKKTKTKNSTTASDQSRDTSSTISSAVNAEPAVSEDQVNKLLATISEQKLQIQNLTQKLDFVLSFLGINDASLVTMNDSTSSVPATTFIAATTTTTSTTYADVASATVNGAAPIQTASSRPVSFHEAVVTAVHADQRARERRAKSVVVSGLATDTGSSDTAAFHRLCVSEFGFDAEVTYTRRLGNVIDGRIQPLLVCLQSAEVATELVKKC